MTDTVKTIGSSIGTLTVNWLHLVPEILGIVLIVVNIVYVIRKIQQTYI